VNPLIVQKPKNFRQKRREDRRIQNILSLEALETRLLLGGVGTTYRQPRVPEAFVPDIVGEPLPSPTGLLAEIAGQLLYGELTYGGSVSATTYGFGYDWRTMDWAQWSASRGEFSYSSKWTTSHTTDSIKGPFIGYSGCARTATYVDDPRLVTVMEAREVGYVD